MTELRVTGQPVNGVRGRIRVPGDKSVSHRALLLGALADGTSRIRGLSDGLDVRHTAGAIELMGAGIFRHDSVTEVSGGSGRLHEPESVVDVGNSATAIRLLAGWCAPRPWLVVLQGDASIAQRPMDRVTTPLRLMGASVDGRDQGSRPPLAVRGGGLRGIDYTPPVASAQVKGAVLLAGLGAEGQTVLREPVPTRAHTEEMLIAFGADVEVEPGAVRIRPSPVHPFELDVPGDPSQAAFWLVAACVTPGSDLVVEQVYVGPGRAAFLDVLRRMGAAVTLESEDAASRVADVRVRYGPLSATTISGTEVPALIDEIPALAVAAALADGSSRFADAGELRVKESDRIDAIIAGLRAFGVLADPTADGLVVEGNAGRPLLPARVDAHGDHRIAMAMAVAALAAPGVTSITGWESVETSYPGFEEELRRCAS
jgi:3-phosphoshikimate 1-carboxyvinyltransferase